MVPAKLLRVAWLPETNMKIFQSSTPQESSSKNWKWDPEPVKWSQDIFKMQIRNSGEWINKACHEITYNKTAKTVDTAHTLDIPTPIAEPPNDPDQVTVLSVDRQLSGLGDRSSTFASLTQVTCMSWTWHWKGCQDDYFRTSLHFHSCQRLAAQSSVRKCSLKSRSSFWQASKASKA